MSILMSIHAFFNQANKITDTLISFYVINVCMVFMFLQITILILHISVVYFNKYSWIYIIKMRNLLQLEAFMWSRMTVETLITHPM